MAEVLGTVVGVVSLGLQVCSGLNDYIDGLQCRKEEIESTIRHQKSLEALIAQIEGLHNRRQTPGICSVPLKESMASAKAELLRLDEYINKIRIEDANGTDRSAGTMMKIQKKRLLYPFRRDRLDRIVTQLDVVIKALQAALQLFELESQLEMKASFEQVLQTASRSEVTMLGIERKIDENASLASLEMKTSFEQVVQTVSRSENTMLAIERKIDENASPARVSDYATKQDVMELKTLMTDLMSSTATGTLKNMVSKPSALKVICDNMTNTEIRSQFRCTCNPQRALRRQKRSFGPVSFAKEAVTKRAHTIGCPFAVFDIHETNSWSAGITLRAFHGLVAAAVNVSLSLTTGADGFGMSPSFACFLMRESSPAFQVVDVLLRAIRSQNKWTDTGLHEWTDKELTKLFQRGIHTLKTIFTSRTSSPFEIDTNGDTLLHVVTKPPGGSFWTDHGHELIEFLLAIGVPRDRANQNDQYAFQNAQTSGYIQRKSDLRAAQIIDALRPHDGTFITELLRRPVAQRDNFGLEVMDFHPTWIKNSITAAQEAVIFRNKSRLLDSLDQQTSLNFSEVDAFNFSYMYHLIGWPEGLKIVLSQYGKSILQSHDKGVLASVLECALRYSYSTCNAPWYSRCLETCPCGEAVGILFQTDNECLARTIRRESWGYTMRFASIRAREMVIDELAGRRQELKALGLRHLKPTEIDRFGLLRNNVLDRHTGDVLKALDDKGIFVHPSLRTEVVDEESRASGSIYHSDWIGFNMDDRIRNAFYSRGFTEVDVRNSHGVVPLANTRNCLHYRKWLVEHGANLTTEVPGRPVGFTTAHMLFCPDSSPRIQSPSLDHTPGLFKSLRSHVSKSASLDSCKCGCSKDGCHPYTVMWRAALWDWSVDQITQASLKKEGDKIIGLCRDFETDWTLSRDERLILLRVCTFMALPICHTCCCSWEQKEYSGWYCFEWAYRVCEEDEVEEIREEDTNELELLENLLVEFESKIDEMGCTLATFFETYWIDRMGQILQDIQDRPLLEEEVQGAERLGIILREEEENREEETSQLEYWIRKLDAIVA